MDGDSEEEPVAQIGVTGLWTIECVIVTSALFFMTIDTLLISIDPVVAMKHCVTILLSNR